MELHAEGDHIVKDLLKTVAEHKVAAPAGLTAKKIDSKKTHALIRSHGNAVCNACASLFQRKPPSRSKARFQLMPFIWNSKRKSAVEVLLE